MKRAICGMENGAASVLIDGVMPRRELANGVGGMSYEVWSTAGAMPTTITRDATLDQAINATVHPGETRFRVVTFPAHYTSAMHRTRTIDYGVVLSGTIDILMGDGTVTHLQPGDCLVQLGAMHSWRNDADTPVTIAFVMVGAERPT